MFNRRKEVVELIRYAAGTDTYGQKKQIVSSTEEIEMTHQIYSQSAENDIRFNDVEVIGLVKADLEISDLDRVRINGQIYSISHIIPSGRLKQVMLKKWQ